METTNSALPGTLTISAQHLAEMAARLGDHSAAALAITVTAAVAYWAAPQQPEVGEQTPDFSEQTAEELAEISCPSEQLLFKLPLGSQTELAELAATIAVQLTKPAEHYLVRYAGQEWQLSASTSGWSLQESEELTVPPSVIANIVDFPERQLGTIDAGNAQSRLADLARWNDTEQERSRPTLVELVQRQAELRPEAPAVIDGERTLSYRQLSERSAQLAHFLLARGLAAESVVAVSLPRGAEMVVALLAILKAGCAFVPLDPQWPAERRALVSSDAGAVLQLCAVTEAASTTVATKATKATEAAAEALPGVEVSLEEWAFGDYPATAPQLQIPGAALAYVIFTSGSTGRPKGAMIRHEAISERLLWQSGEILHFGPEDAALFKAPLAFDISINEVFLPLVTGGRLVIAKPGGERDPNYLLDVIHRQRVSFTYLVSSMLDVLLEMAQHGNELSSLKHVWCGGELLTKDLYDRFRRQLDIPMYHGYGPAEATIGVSHVIYRGEAERLSASIGKANPNTELYVLDDQLRPVPIGVGGELYAGGFLLGRGYVNAPGLTAARFVANPFGAPGSRLYRTGDLARFAADGSLEFLGRADNQVKIRGMRLELEEVESTLSQHPLIRQASVLAKQNSRGGSYLVGYLLPVTGKNLDLAELKLWCQNQMPEYMIPSHLVVLEEFPLTANGKLDRRALPEPVLEASGEAQLAASASDAERVVSEQIADVLQLGTVGLDQDFFELGGDSILAISLLSALRRNGLHVTVTDIFGSRTTRGIAAAASQQQASPVGTDSGAGSFGGLPIVRWLGERSGRVDGFVQSVLFETPEALNAEALEAMLMSIVSRHPMLRARLRREQPWGFEVPEDADAQQLWQRVELAADSTASTAQVSEADFELALKVATDAAIERLDPEAGTMLQAVWFPVQQRLLLVAHHLVIDGVSWRILLDDLDQAWQQLSSGQAIELANTGMSMKTWTETLEQAAETTFAADLSYWQRALPGVDQQIGRAALSGQTVAEERLHTVTVDAATTSALLGELPGVFHATVNDVLLTALSISLARWRKQLGQRQTFAHIELEGHGREGRAVLPLLGREADLSRTVGWFTTLFPVIVDPGELADQPEQAALAAALKRVKDQLAKVPSQGLSWGVGKYLGSATGGSPEAPDAQIAQRPDCQVLFNYLGRFGSATAKNWRMLGNSRGGEQLGERRDASMELPRALEFNAIIDSGSDGEHQLSTVISWPEGIFHEADIQLIAEYWREALVSLAQLADLGSQAGHSSSDFPLIELSQQQVDSFDGEALLDLLPLTPLQQGLYFHSVFDDDSAGQYVEQQIISLQGPCDRQRLFDAAKRLFEIFPNLAARFSSLEDGRLISVQERGIAPQLQNLDFSAQATISEAAAEQAIAEFAEQDRLAGFDLAVAPLMRYTLIRLAPEHHVLVQTVHHIIADGWSVPQMLNTLLAEYHAPGSVLRPSNGYSEYLAWLQEQDAELSSEVWREQLRGLEQPSLLRPGHSPSNSFSEVDFDFGRIGSLEASLRQSGSTLSVAVHTAWGLALGKLLGQSDLVFGSTVSGREADLPGIAEMVGLFINTVPVRSSLFAHNSEVTSAELTRAEPTLADLLSRMRQQHDAVRPYQHESLGTIQRQAGLGTLFDALVVFDLSADASALGQPSDTLRISQIDGEGAPHYPLTLAVMPRQGAASAEGLAGGLELAVKLIYDAEAVTENAARGILEDFVAALQAIGNDDLSAALPRTLLPDALLLDPAVDLNSRIAPLAAPEQLTLPELFDRAARRFPEKTALRMCRFSEATQATAEAEGAPDAKHVLGSERLSYAELAARKDRIAAALSAAGLGLGDFAAVATERSLHQVTALIGVVTAGGASVPLDLAYPDERLAFILADAQPRVVLTTAEQSERIYRLLANAADMREDSQGLTDTRVLLIEEILVEEGLGAEPTGAISEVLERSVQIPWRSAAYLIYTSGSTGTPKGVLVEHRSVVTMLASMSGLLKYGADDVWTMFHSFGFDVSVWEMWGALTQGAELLVPDHALTRSPMDFLTLVRERAVTMLVQSPSALYRLIEADQQAALESAEPLGELALRHVVFGGEPVDAARLRPWVERYGVDSPDLINLYGLTESAVNFTYRVLDRGQLLGDDPVTLGGGIPGSAIYLLDEQLQPVQAGESGLLYLGGPQVARGYWQRPGLTAARFVPNPFANDGSRLYNTGDVVRLTDAGELEFVGRVDDQVQLNGFRVELGEIEAAARELAGVLDCVVLLSPQRDQLAACLLLDQDAPAEASGAGQLQSVQSQLAERLPAHMVPQRLEAFATLPLTVNNKRDRKALAAKVFGAEQQQSGSAVAPEAQQGPGQSTEQLERLKEIFSNALGAQDIDADTDFFARGGDSIVAISVVNQARAAGITLSPSEIFLLKTPAKIAAKLAVANTAAAAQQDRVAQNTRPSFGPVPLTPIMHRWRELQPTLHNFALARTIKLPGGLEEERLRTALRALLQSHPTLRMQLNTEPDDLWSLEIPEEAAEPQLLRVSAGEPQRLAEAAMSRLRPLAGQMSEFVWIDNGTESGTLVIVIHHLVMDAVSWIVLLDDLNLLLDGKTPAISPVSYREYAERLNQAAQRREFLADMPHWLEMLDAPALIAEPSSGGSWSLEVDLPKEASAVLFSRLPQLSGLGLTELLCGALRSALTAVQAEPTPLSIELERHGRTGVDEVADYSQLAGWFTAIAPLKLSPQYDPLVAAREVAQRQLSEQRSLGFGLLRYLNPQSALRLAAKPTPQILLNYLGRGTETGVLQLSTDPGARTDYAVEVNTWGESNEGAETLRTAFTLSTAVPLELGLRISEEWLKALQQLVSRAEGSLGASSGVELSSERSLPLAPLQRGLYFQAQMASEPGQYLAQNYLAFDHALDPVALAQAASSLLERHPLLGAGFRTEESGQIVQFTAAGQQSVPLELVDLRAETEEVAAERLKQHRDADREQGFDLLNPPLIRLTLFRLPSGTDSLLLSNHLLLWDGWSHQLVLRDLFEAYEQAVEGKAPSLATAGPGFAEYIQALDLKDASAAEEFWSERLAGLASPTLLAGDRVAAAAQQAPEKLLSTLSEQQTAQLSALARRQGVTLNSLLSGAFALLLGEYSGSNDVVFGLTVAGRTDPAESGVDYSAAIGVLLNTIPQRIRAEAAMSVPEFLAAVQTERVETMPYEYLELGEIQRLSEHQQLFDNLFVLQNFFDADAAEEFYSRHGIAGSESEDATHFPFTWVVMPGSELRITLEYRPDLSSRDRAEELLERFVEILEQLNGAGDGVSIGSLARTNLPAPQPGREFPALSIPELFDRSAAKHRADRALVCAGQSMTFGELQERSIALAQRLTRSGVRPESSVAIAIPRSLESIVALFAVLRTGAGYVPLELDHPDERLAAILQDAQPQVVLTVSAVASRVQGFQQILLDQLAEPEPDAAVILAATLGTVDHPVSAAVFPGFEPEAAHRLRHSAYTIYTSGSTGKPKGVVVEYAGLTNMLLNHQRRIFEPVLAAAGHRRFRVAHTVSFAFDMSWEELLWLADGHEVHICDENLRRDPAELAAYLQRERIDVINVTPTFAQQLVAEGVLEREHQPALILLGGEAVSAQLWSKLAEHPQVVGYNLYGPTEYTINTLGVGTFDCQDPVIGTPIDNTNVYVLDEWLRPVPDSVPGELYVSGVGLARGYLGLPAMTSARFIACPFQPGERMYRTGDLVRRRPDGNIDYLGRTDDQVKIRGYRVEPGEIEAVITDYPAVGFAAVTVSTDPATSLNRLNAFIGLKQQAEGADSSEQLTGLLGHLSAVLPDYMLPSHYALIDGLPLTVNGKLDARALPVAQPISALLGLQRTEPSSETEELVCEFFAEVLGLDDDEVRLEDDFFGLGGHSMLAIRLVGMLRAEFGEVVSIKDLFALRTPAALAIQIEETAN
ncbi:non-ribosomal peptide synthetase [Psychromicrobium lacuslunae]|uniref:Carrier domain-containing protein n=1 Tax=Psychromicrobium lacuslunae TaxID=1618207 RepID=A0A0D4BWH6_9MICC|nr:non-ribosomal peptide synthetase [Psychromicrobium lacuslunae]AJT40663.1 hypothetical protein UM93_02395 [Psychromicrobium lacuslunae]